MSRVPVPYRPHRLRIGTTAAVLAAIVYAVAAGEAGAVTLLADEPGDRVYNVDIHVFAGSVTIRPHPEDRFAVEGATDTDDAFIEVERTRSGFVVAVRRRHRPGRYGSDITVEVPAGVRLHVVGKEADVTIEDAGDSVYVRTYTGAIDLTREGTHPIDLRSTSGPISVHGGSLRNAKIKSVSGRIDVSAERASSAHIGTTDGDISLSVDRFRSGEIELRSASGTTRLTLGSESAAWIEMPPRGADIDPSPQLAERRGFGVSEGRRGLSYRVGAGFARVYISNTGGRIVLRVD